MNEQNLRPLHQSHEEATKNGRKGGIASGKVRKKNATLKQLCKMVGDMSAPGDAKKIMTQMGIPEDEQTVLMSIAVMTGYQAALGDKDARRDYVKFTGEDPEEKRKDADLKLRKESLDLQKEQSAFRNGTDTQRQEPAIRARAALMAQVEAEMRNDGSDS